MSEGLKIQSGRSYNRALNSNLKKKHRPILLKELAEMTGLTTAAVTKILNSFIEAAIVTEEPPIGKQSSTGMPVGVQ